MEQRHFGTYLNTGLPIRKGKLIKPGVMRKKTLFLFFLIFILGAFLRFYRLGEVPVGLHTDEVYLGYNAFSILKTGNEITGNFLPIHLKSFLFSPAGYVYSSIPFIFLFGLDSFSIRFSSALFGSLTIFITFVLVKKIFEVSKKADYIALSVSFFLAISPWHINLSRVATDNVLVVFFITIGVMLYLYWLERGKNYLFFLSVFSFFITLFIYQAPRSFLPLFLPFLFLLFSKKIFTRKNLIPLVSFILVIVLPVLFILNSSELSYRIKTLSIFQNPQTQLVLNEQLREDGVAGLGGREARVFNNKIVNYSNTFLQIYFKHFSFDFLFTDAGLPERYRVPGMGLLYLFELPLLLLGIWKIFSLKKRLGFFIIGWILLAPFGSALTFDDVPNLQRTLLMFPALSILIGLGFFALLEYLNKNVKKRLVLKTVYLLIAAVMFYGIAYYFQAYYIHQVFHRPWYRQEGYQKLVAELNKYSKNYTKIVVTDAGYNPSIFLLFYNKYDPLKIQKVIVSNKGTDYGDISFSKFKITKERCPLREEVLTDLRTGLSYLSIKGEKGVLYVNDGACKIPNSGIKVLSQIKRSDGTLVFQLIKKI